MFVFSGVRSARLNADGGVCGGRDCSPVRSRLVSEAVTAVGVLSLRDWHHGCIVCRSTGFEDGGRFCVAERVRGHSGTP